MKYVLALIIGGFIYFIYALCRISSISSEKEEEMRETDL